VTNGVGPLSAINGVGGSCSEHVPVICIVGSIPLRSIERRLGMHHTMADGSFDHFLDAYAHVTAANARLTPRNAATEIDRLILTAWREKLPVYMELPSDIAYLDIQVPAGPLVLADAPSDPERPSGDAQGSSQRRYRRCPARHEPRSTTCRDSGGGNARRQLRQADSGYLLAGHPGLPAARGRAVRRQWHGIRSLRPEVSPEMHLRRIS